MDVLLLSGQGVHESTVPLAANAPYGHSEHTPFFMKYPSPHRHAEEELEYATAVESAGQAVGPTLAAGQ
jgi:hypothetical protein